MRYLLLLFILFLPCAAHSAGVNTLITKDKTVSDWVGVDTEISDTILLGRSIITEHRKRHNAFSIKAEIKSDKKKMLDNHKSETDRTIKQLMVLGFEGIADFIQQSNDKDKNEGLDEKDWWR